MDSANAQSWAGMDSTDQDFGNLIDFDHFDHLDLPDFNGIAFSHAGSASAGLAESSLQVHSNHFSPQIPQDLGDGGVSTAQQSHGIQGGHAMSQQNTGFFDYGMAQFSQANTPIFTQAPDQVYRPQHGVPPTPNSVEMHGDPHRYMRQMDSQQALYDQRYHLRKDDASFTPLVSPAVTPHDARFQIPDFTVPGAYFSPLTSPALNAQSHQPAQLHSQNTTSGSSTGHSPNDIDMDMLDEPAIGQPDQGRRLRSTNKRNIPRATNSSARVRQSPIVKPGRRKPTFSSLVVPKEVTELMKDARSGGLDVPRSRDQSETDSISPEPMLSEMRPPPIPGSVTHSPAMRAQPGSQGTTPATPASLMRIHPSPRFDAPSGVPPILEDLALPEASLDRPPLSRLDTAFRDEETDTPRMSARKTPKLNPLSTPGASLSARPSPMLDPMSTPTSPAFSMTGKKPDPKTGRNLKKRNSVSTSLVSPALRPKISPSIKPLLASGDSSATDNTHALLLASKSNYQNILDGTTVPGVVYPSSLSTNLTSKRTSHKIAEQGRRNRINTALQEMQDLLPPSHNVTPDAKSPETAAQANNSKAAKVESAIDYIKQLKEQCSEKDRLLSEKDIEMEALRKELAALRRSSSVSTPNTSETAAQPKSEPVTTPTASDET